MSTNFTTYVAHYTPLRERVKSIENQLSLLDLDASWISYEPTDFSEEKSGYRESQTLWRQRTNMPHYANTPFRRLRNSEISLAYKHIEIYKRFVRSDYEHALILEDDIIFNDNTSDFFECLTLDKLDFMKFDCIFLGGCCPMKSNCGEIKYNNQHFVLQDDPASRCTDGYLINKSAAKKILGTIIPYVLPIDFELSWHFRIHNMFVWHMVNPIISHNPKLESSIQPNV